MASSTMSSADAFALRLLDGMWQGIRVLTIVVGGPALVLYDMYVGGAYYDSIFNFTFGPSFVKSAGPWLISVATSAAQIWFFQWVTSFRRKNLPRKPIEIIALVGIILLMNFDTAADVGGATQLMYGEQYISSLVPDVILPEWVVGAGVTVLISLLADPFMGYFVGSRKPSATE